ncbi:cAMP-binding domain of CRP or a regulatory subunit of cAMP-dependent protein kinases [Kaistia soli DSM 19436]|uniref:cAMP-binding domain of CRP or a regulatory subunit of cAMP-dependent protein kinases n=1 Tax=Kaistia soli DSM 19436 TaxID=1122133 RepID=A0A1M4UI41_9HYPH|nr:Crp/Fnr family transcriptional regulator [Kaistia soli]SHE56335.1 cAMP-binding domain of CRP or a regulatory subunit of cAMP-dependent protein kinases [Kaistia soli DSM 19436]
MTSIERAREIAISDTWLREAPESFRRAVIERCMLQRFEPSQVIYSPGDGDGGIYCLISGSVRVSVASADDGPFFAHIMQPGIWIGEGPLISRAPRVVGLSAGRQSEVLLLPLPAIQSILESQPIGWKAVARLTFDHLQTAMTALNDLMIRDDRRRMIATLLRLGGCRLAPGPDPVPTPIDLSHEDLAVMANLARSTAATILHGLAQADLVELAYRRVILREPDRLRALLAHD